MGPVKYKMDFHVPCSPVYLEKLLITLKGRIEVGGGSEEGAREQLMSLKK